MLLLLLVVRARGGETLCKRGFDEILNALEILANASKKRMEGRIIFVRWLSSGTAHQCNDKRRTN